MADKTQIHATAVALEGLGILLRGPSGSGKSDLGIRLIDRGAVLIADDRVDLRRRGDNILASPPNALAGKIESGVVVGDGPSGIFPSSRQSCRGRGNERLRNRKRSISGRSPCRAHIAAFRSSATARFDLRRAPFPGLYCVFPPTSDLEQRANVHLTKREPRHAAELVLVTGLSRRKIHRSEGAGGLELEALDNLPLNLLGPLLNPPERDWPDAADENRSPSAWILNRDFGVQSFRDHLDRSRRTGRASVESYSWTTTTRNCGATKTKHPLAMTARSRTASRWNAAIWPPSPIGRTRASTTVLKPGGCAPFSTVGSRGRKRRARPFRHVLSIGQAFRARRIWFSMSVSSRTRITCRR